MGLHGPVLVGHDGSEEAALACSWAASMARAADRSLVVAHTYSIDDYPGGPDVAAAGAKAKLEGWLAAADLDGLPADRVELVVRSGAAGQAIVAVAESAAAGLVVLGGHGRPMTASALGRVAQHVTFRSPCPVAVVHGRGGLVSRAPLLVGFDAAAVNQEVIDWAAELACQLGVGLEAVTVERPHKDLMPADELRSSLAGRFGPTARFSRMVGDPARQLLLKAVEVDAAAIVIGQRRKHNLGGRLLGHVASWLLRKSDRPVIVLNHD